MLDTSAEQAGKVFVSTERGGGGSVTAASVAIADAGIHRFLVHTGVCRGKLDDKRHTVMLDMPDDACYTQSEHDGLLEMCKGLGDYVELGDVLARVYDPTRTGVPGIAYRANCNGVLTARHFPGLVQCGDTLAVVARVVSDTA